MKLCAGTARLRSRSCGGNISPLWPMARAETETLSDLWKQKYPCATTEGEGSLRIVTPMRDHHVHSVGRVRVDVMSRRKLEFMWPRPPCYCDKWEMLTSMIAEAFERRSVRMDDSGASDHYFHQRCWSSVPTSLSKQSILAGKNC